MVKTKRNKRYSTSGPLVRFKERKDDKTNYSSDFSDNSNSSSGTDHRNLKTQESQSSDSDENDKKHKLEGYSFPGRHHYKDSKIVYSPIEYSRLLTEIVNLSRREDYKRNCFFTDNEGREIEWPHVSKSNITMKSIYPMTSNVDLRVNGDSLEDKTHVLVSNNQARKMIFTTYKYSDHHSTPSFVKEYNQYVLGMMYKYKVLMEAILKFPEDTETIPEESLNQRVFACIHVQRLASAVFDYELFPIGKLNEQYIRHYVEGIESEEDAKFVLAMANCETFELESKFLYEPDREPHTGVWIIYTKVFFSNVKGNSNKETYAFGWNKTIYPRPKIFDMNLPYDQECNHRKRKFGEDDY